MTAYTIRSLEPADLGALVELCRQLGRPASRAELEERYAQLRQSPGQGLFVAVAEGGEVAGWLHVQERPALHTPRSAEVTALVVDAAHRRAGCGRALLAAAEAWARGLRCQVLALRSGVDRAEAHTFYRSLGFEQASASYKFTKPL